MNEAEETGKALWPGSRHDQLALEVDQKRPTEQSGPEDQDAADEQPELQGQESTTEQLELGSQEEGPKALKGGYTLYRGMRLPPGVTPEIVDEWLKAERDQNKDKGRWPPPGRDDRDRGI